MLFIFFEYPEILKKSSDFNKKQKKKTKKNRNLRVITSPRDTLKPFKKLKKSRKSFPLLLLIKSISYKKKSQNETKFW